MFPEDSNIDGRRGSLPMQNGWALGEAKTAAELKALVDEMNQHAVLGRSLRHEGSRGSHER